MGERLGDKPGNAFIADAGDTGARLTVGVRWDSDDTLRVNYDSRLRLFRNEAKVRRVDVKYVPVTGTP
ncbi:MULTISPECIES: hypothetical protein [Anaeromyxobacter]|uniref:hypothetical protein n=1 Tax=Anaeromyxobacter TaxID=161492 RepID=UPI001F59721D|nr:MULTISPECIES: hypothetical protein [unclassified Anaeromyxobacter]